MRFTMCTAGVALALSAGTAAAQPGAMPPPAPSPTTPGPAAGAPAGPDGLPPRAGRALFGLSVGVGGLSVGGEDVTCATCAGEPLGFEGDLRAGAMLTERLGLLLEVQANAETVYESRSGTTRLTQVTAVAAAQYWLHPHVWVKAGLGVAHLSYDSDDGYGATTEPVDDGAAVLLAAGAELLKVRTFALDVQARLVTAAYEGLGERVTAATLGLGFNWYGVGPWRRPVVIVP